MKKILKAMAIVLALGAAIQTVQGYSKDDVASISEQEHKLQDLLSQSESENMSKGQRQEIIRQSIKYLKMIGAEKEAIRELKKSGLQHSIRMERGDGPGV